MIWVVNKEDRIKMTKEEAFDFINHIMYSSPHESTEQIVKKKYYAELLKDYIADTVEVVRCKECKYRGEYFSCPIPYRTDDNFFCGHGDRKELV